MKLDGETVKFKVPATVKDVIKDHPEHVLLDSEAVKHLGVRAKAMGEYMELKPRRLYFLVQLPKVEVDDHHGRAPRRVQSGAINVGAKERLESLMLSRRSMSDLTLLKAAGSTLPAPSASGADDGMQVRMKLPKAVVTKIMEGSKDNREAAEKIMALCATLDGQKPTAAARSAIHGRLPPVPEGGSLEKKSCMLREVRCSNFFGFGNIMNFLTTEHKQSRYNYKQYK